MPDAAPVRRYQRPQPDDAPPSCPDCGSRLTLPGYPAGLGGRAISGYCGRCRRGVAYQRPAAPADPSAAGPPVPCPRCGGPSLLLRHASRGLQAFCPTCNVARPVEPSGLDEMALRRTADVGPRPRPAQDDTARPTQFAQGPAHLPRGNHHPVHSPHVGPLRRSAAEAGRQPPPRLDPRSPLARELAADMAAAHFRYSRARHRCCTRCGAGPLQRSTCGGRPWVSCPACGHGEAERHA
jgi:hypothetical protein